MSLEILVLALLLFLVLGPKGFIKIMGFFGSLWGKLLKTQEKYVHVFCFLEKLDTMTLEDLLQKHHDISEKKSSPKRGKNFLNKKKNQKNNTLKKNKIKKNQQEDISFKNILK